MKNLSLLAVLAAVVFSTALFASPAVAQTAGQPAARAVAPVVLLDINAVFKGYRKMQDEMNRMKADVERAEQEVKAERDAIRAQAEKLQRFRKGTTDYKNLEEELTERQAKLSTRVQLQKKDFLEREAQIFHRIYQEVQQEVAYYASQTGVSLVLRTSGTQADVQNPQEVLAYINRDVIWNAQQLDITNYITERLNRRYGGGTAGQAAGTQSRAGVYPNAATRSTQPAGSYQR